jgi:hypothetical protein
MNWEAIAAVVSIVTVFASGVFHMLRALMTATQNASFQSQLITMNTRMTRVETYLRIVGRSMGVKLPTEEGDL